MPSSPLLILAGLLLTVALLGGHRPAVTSPQSPSVPTASASPSLRAARVGLFPGHIWGLSLDHLLLLSIGAGYGALQLRRALTQPPSATPPDDREPEGRSGNEAVPPFPAPEPVNGEVRQPQNSRRQR